MSRLLPPRERRRLLFPDEWDLFSAFDIWCQLFVPGGPARRFRVEPLVLEDHVLTVLGPTSRLFGCRVRPRSRVREEASVDGASRLAPPP